MWPMFYIESEPMSEVSRLHRTVNRIFDGYGEMNAAFPAVNAWYNDTETVVSAEVPGIDPKSINVTVSGALLTIEGERKPDQPGENVTVVRQERETGRFSRTLRLPYEVEAGSVKATSAYGVLRIALPRKESTKPKQITVEAN